MDEWETKECDVVDIKGVNGCKIHFTSCLNINVCWKYMCVHIHPIMIKIHPVFFLKSPFWNQAVLRFLSEWHSSIQATPTVVDCLTLDPPWVSWELSAIVLTRVQGKTRCLRFSYWGVLLLAVIMNIAVVVYSRHLSRWRRRGLTFVFEGNAPPDQPKCVYVRANHSWSSFTYRRSEHKGF